MQSTGLPIDRCLDEVAAALSAGGELVVVAPPGAGKTTVIPLLLLEQPWRDGRRIMLLEPRRLATRAAARRMAQMTGTTVGDLVGYVTRDERHVSARTLVEVVTEGVLTRRLQNDPSLEGYAAVIFDEVHERNLQTDLGMALALECRRLLRPDLRIVAMSATIDAQRFAGLLGRSRPTGDAAPIVSVDVEPYPLEIRWAPKGAKEPVPAAFAGVVLRALRECDGDVLGFLPGAAEIGTVERLVRDAVEQSAWALGPVDIYPLFGMLPIAEQDLALAPSPPGRRRVVLATDIAETSLTVDGVTVVVDAGLARVPKFDTRTGLTRLRTVTASKANADQRAGRAARRGPGVAYRLWSKGEHTTRPRQLTPEILDVDLTGFVLELAIWGSPIESLDFIDLPTKRSLQDAQSLLQLLELVDDDGRVTTLGREAGRLPVHPRLARMLARTSRGAEQWVACCLATMLEERDILRGGRDEVPADAAIRLDVLLDRRDHPLVDRRALATVRRRAFDLLRRVGGEERDPSVQQRAQLPGRLLAQAYPDRLAVARSQPGRFQLRSGASAWVVAGDPLAHDQFVVAADLDGDRREARIRLGAALDVSDVIELFADQIAERVSLDWDRDRDELVERVERRLGGMVLDTIVRRPQTDDAVIEALVGRVRADGLAALPWTGAAQQFRDRVRFLGRVLGEPWPDWSDESLLADVGEWLPAFLVGARGTDALAALDMAHVMRCKLDPRLSAELESLAPSHFRLGARLVAIDYGPDQPVLASKIQDFFGVTNHPAIVGGRVPLVLQLLSPAGRPVQITADLPRFWSGTWAEVRKEMAGRYPKHAWPQDPHSGQRR